MDFSTATTARNRKIENTSIEAFIWRFFYDVPHPRRRAGPRLRFGVFWLEGSWCLISRVSISIETFCRGRQKTDAN